ncbi:MAG: leucine-rich repeat protein [Coprococcus sp.]|nr:leucine-rich repeat protein [Coprococcus sp.]
MNKQALQTKLKRLLIAGGLAALVAVPLLSGNAGMRKVDAAQGDVKINSTNFPDAEFRKYISKNIDRNKDGVLSKAEIKKVIEIKLEHYDEAGNEYVYNDLTGIGVFTELKGLECESQKDLSKLDLHKNTKLEFVKCGRNGIKELNVSKLTKLKELRCYVNKLTKLDVSKNVNLEILDCESNNLTGLDLRKNTKLVELYCGGNKLTKLDLTKNTKLNNLWCYDNKLTKLDVSKNTKLFKINCDNNKLTKLDLTKNLNLIYLYCSGNKLTGLNVDKNEKLECLWCNDNKLTKLRLTNNKQLVSLECTRNQLTQLDTSHNNALVWVDCADNKLTKLDLSASPLCQRIVCEENKLTEIIVPKNMETDGIMYDKNLKVSIKKKTKPVKNGTYFVEDTYNHPYCIFRVTSTKAGNRTAALGVWSNAGAFGTKGWKRNMKGIKYGNQTYKLTSIDSGAFAGATFSEYDGNNNIVIGGSIKTIGSKAFAGTKVLKTITLGTSVEKIGSYAFANSRDLKVLKIKTTKLTSKTLSKKTFAGITSKTTVKVPKSKLSAYKKLFRKCGLSKNVKFKAI